MNFLSDKITRLEHSATEEVDNAVKRMKQEGITDIVSLGVGEPTPVGSACWIRRSTFSTRWRGTCW